MTLEQRAEKWRGEVMHWDCECSDDHLAAFARTELLKAAEIADTYGSEVAKRVIGKPIADEIRRLAE